MADDIVRAKTVGSAEHVDVAEHVSTVQTTDQVIHTQTPEARKVTALRWLAAVFAAIAVASIVLVAGYVLVTKDSTIREVTARLDETQERLEAAQSAAIVTERDRAVRAECNDRFIALQRSSNLQVQTVEFELVVGLIPTDPPTPVEERRPALLAVRDRGAAALAEYDAAIKAYNAWTAAEKPLPCPIPEA